ncbi:MAG: hypothetical protein DWP98_04645 [Bacteroidetes bacterium]|nr:MAG: hypothetical protein DWP98_04645 [Bacteroidota bacterium]MBL1144653.1 hypothetical protein [Bacteroidota bacterium]MCB0802309.1 hypothetical protein [Flavobacteriales bacterium]NOG57448.1 hypothetical protein [Bacteroidota bacterium]
MYKDIISYELAENVSVKHLTTVAKKVVNNWMKKQPGFKKWEIHSNNDGTYTDIVYWASKGDAKNAEKEMGNIPNATDWFECYKQGSISSKNLTLIAEL